MVDRVITVFGASGRQGLAQIRQLRLHGYSVRAASRSPQRFAGPEFDGVTGVKADYNDYDSLVSACAGAVGVFFSHPMFEDSLNVHNHIARLSRAVLATGVRRLVYNTSSWVPDEPCGNLAYDTNLMRENLFAAAGVPLTIIRPVLFMDNLLTNWVKPALVNEGVYRYPHRATMGANWICLDDVAKFMIAAFEQEAMRDQRIVIGGPELLLPEQVAATLSVAMNKPIRYEYITPRQFGELMYDLFGSVSPLDREIYAAAMDDFYTYCNAQGGRTFQVDMAPVVEQMPVELTTLAQWAAQQDWSLREDGPSGG